MSQIQIPIYNSSGNEQEALKLDDLQALKRDESIRTFSYAIKSLLFNWRQGTVGCKDRGGISFSNKKPWKQKGTGRARAGTLRSPLWRKGGVIFGPQPRTRTLSINRKQKKLVLNNIFHNFLEDKKLCCLDLSFDKPSTRGAFDALKKIDKHNKKVLIFLPFADESNWMSFRNIPNISVLSFDQADAYNLTKNDRWIFLKKDLDLFKNMIAAWN
ncbi:50S ribosomal protein L4 [Candidatus Babeliales bacterium]|nr:50S ribosomal protein L4 [Candidatus Babeliales bacterium]